MHKFFILLSLITLCFLQLPTVFAATQITGTVTAKRGDSLQVEFQPHKTAAPIPGDKVGFSVEIAPEIYAAAGTGKVIEVDENVVWVQTSDQRPDLTMNAVIHATGSAKNKKAIRKNNKPPLHRCDELAGDPYDNQAIGPTVRADKISASSAIPACKEALQNYPDTIRFLFQLGRAYAADKQYQAAYSYFKKAADKGHITAQNYIGDLFSRGWGVTKDKLEAYRWYLKAAEQGYVLAQFDVGKMNWDGVVIPQDLAEAVKWFTKYAEQAEQGRIPLRYNTIVTQYTLGMAYEGGHGVTKNHATAEKWYRKAVSQKEFDWTTYKLGEFLYYKDDGEQSQSTREAAKWFQKAAEKGHKLAQYRLGVMYYTGTGIQEDYTLALQWYRKAAENGVADAQWDLGIMYYSGQGVEQNFELAKKWFQKAADQKHKQAIKMLKELKR